MKYVEFVIWILMWGGTGYFTVRAIQMHIEKKRIEKARVVRDKLCAEQLKYSKTARGHVRYNPFKGIL